jgi:hypothetical protein
MREDISFGFHLLWVCTSGDKRRGLQSHLTLPRLRTWRGFADLNFRKPQYLRVFGAGDGNRTHVRSLGHFFGCNSVAIFSRRFIHKMFGFSQTGIQS